MSDPSGPLLERDDLIDGLRALITKLHSRDTGARIRIVGGAAIALTVHADRAAIVDIDAPSEPADTVRDAAAAIATQHGWRTDWLNDVTNPNTAVFTSAAFPLEAQFEAWNDQWHPTAFTRFNSDHDPLPASWASVVAELVDSARHRYRL